MWPWSKASKPEARPVFALGDDDRIAQLEHADAADVFEDIFVGRDIASEVAGTYVGNMVTVSRIRIGIVVMALALGIFLARIFFWQIVQGEEHRTLADANRTQTITIPADRGVIKDRSGIVLAWNEPSFRLIATPRELPEAAAERDELFTRAANVLGIADTVPWVAALTKGKDDAAVLLEESLVYDRALAFMAQDTFFDGLTIELGAQRAYATDAIPTLSHVLGYTSSISDDEYTSFKDDGYRKFDDIGKQGLEKTYETQLRGTPGKEIREVDAAGHAIRTLSQSEIVDGNDLTLTIDARLQAAIEYILGERLALSTVKRASVVAMEPESGEVLALVSYPSYDANDFSRGISTEEYAALVNDPNAPLFPRATSGGYPSGSTIKPVYAAAALMEGIITPVTSFLSVGGIWVGPKFYPDWRAGGHGVTNVYHAIADSVNTFFYIIGGGNEAFNGMGLETLMRYAALFGFGSDSGIDLPDEADGFLPSKAWKQEAKGEPWYIGDTYNVSIGQGDFLVSPLQIARSTAVFANGGNLVVPHLAMDAARSAVDIVPDDVVDVIRDAMRQTVVNGSATSLGSLPVAVAGKTGTAQWSSVKNPHSWFTGFAPFDDPEIVVTVLVEEGGDHAYAIPIARDIFDWWYANRQRDRATDEAGTD